MRRVSRVSSEPPPNSTATSNSSRIAAKFLDVDDIGSPPDGTVLPLAPGCRRILPSPGCWPDRASVELEPLGGAGEQHRDGFVGSAWRCRVGSRNLGGIGSEQELSVGPAETSLAAPMPRDAALSWDWLAGGGARRDEVETVAGCGVGAAGESAGERAATG